MTHVRIFEEQPDLLDGVEPTVAARFGALSVPVLTLEPGPWVPTPGQRAAAVYGFMLVEGMLLRRVRVLGKAPLELLGPGDLLLPSLRSTRLLVPRPHSREAMVRSRVAVFDERFQRLAARVPQLNLAVVGRGVQRTCSMMVLQALVGMDPPERLLVLLWHLAEVWGRPSGEAIELPLPLTQETLARLTSQRRGVITKRAIPDLIEAGRIDRVGRARGQVFYLFLPAPVGIDGAAILDRLERRAERRDAGGRPPAG